MALNQRKWLPLLLSALLALSFIPAFAQTEAAEQEAEQVNLFAQLPLTYLDGTPFDASVFEGMPIFLNIWATRCSPCVTEMPILNELAQEYKDRIAIVGLHAESLTVSEEGELVNDEEKIALAIEMREKMNLTYALLNPERTLFILMNNPSMACRSRRCPPPGWWMGKAMCARLS
ncbi:MAG: TlpA family protein disulfide reductase [Clostridiales bacterium]|nr:TlpA family protein disulfide reductase [Clostridiales bacterium]